MERIQILNITANSKDFCTSFCELMNNKCDWLKFEVNLTYYNPKFNEKNSYSDNCGSFDIFNQIENSPSFNNIISRFIFTSSHSLSYDGKYTLFPYIYTNYTSYQRPGAMPNDVDRQYGTRFNRIYEVYITENVIAFSFIDQTNKSQFSNACFILSKTNNNEVAVITTSAFPEKSDEAIYTYNSSNPLKNNYITSVTRMSVNDQNCLFTIDPTYPKTDDITLLNPVRVLGSDDYCKDVFFTHSCPFKGQDTYFMLDGVKYLYNGYLAIKC